MQNQRLVSTWSSSSSRFVLTRNSREDKSFPKVTFVSQTRRGTYTFTTFYLWCLTSNFTCLSKRTVCWHSKSVSCWNLCICILTYQYCALTFSSTLSCSPPFRLAYFSMAPSGTPPRVLARPLNAVRLIDPR